MQIFLQILHFMYRFLNQDNLNMVQNIISSFQMNEESLYYSLLLYNRFRFLSLVPVSYTLLQILLILAFLPLSYSYPFLLIM